MILKYGSIFIVMTGLIISSTLINVNADKMLQDEKGIAAYVSPNSPLLNEFKSRINLERPEYFLTSDRQTTNLVLRYQISINALKPVHSVEWLTLYLYKRHIIFNKEFQVVFNDDMDQHHPRRVDFIFPIKSISRNNRTFFLSPNSEIEAITLPKSIQYLDGGRLEIPY